MATADNLKIAQQLLATMQQITVQVERQTEAYHAQAQLVDALCKAQECFGKIDAAKVKEVTDALKEAQEKTKEFGNELSNVSEKEVSKLEGALRNIAEKVKEISVPAEFANGFKAGLTLSTNLFKNILSLGGSAFGLLKDIGRIFISLPGRLLDFFQGAAGSGTDPYRQALEDLREEFGDLSVGTSAAVKNMTESTKSLGESGLRLSRVFGYGREGLANMLKENMEMFKQMGPLANRLAASLRGAEGEFTLLRKATGLTGEAMKAFQLRAEETGMSGARATREMTLALAQGQKAFGISIKEFGKDIEVMLKDTITFGIKAPAEMVKVSAYVKKLGISMETLKKVTDKAFNFEDAAQQAAKLSEAFGIALDPLKQMEADPVKKMDNLRQAFFKTGQSYESMSAQARKYLADQAGISDEEARIAFSQKNRAMTGAQVEAQMKKQQKAQMSQAEAMKILAESVKRLVQSGSAMKGSFFDVFAKGFESGIRRTKEFREVTRKLQQSMRTVYWAGRDVGRMFVKEFPGIKEMFKGLADMFNPRRFRELMKQVKEEFSKFFKALQTDPKAGVQEFMKNMKKIFFDFFTKGAPAGSRFLDGLKAFYKTVGAIFVEGLRYALDGLKNVLGVVIGFIRDPSSLKRMATDTGDGLKGMFVQAFSYLVKELGPVLKVIGGQIVELMSLLFEKYIKPHLLKLVALIFGPALFMGVARAAGAAILKVGFEKVLTGFINRIPGVTQAAQAGGAGGGATSAAGAAQQTESFGKDLLGFAKSMIKVALAMAIIAVAVRMLMPIIISIAKVIDESGVSKESIAFTAVLLGIFGALFIGIGKMIKGISESKLTPSDLLKAGGVMLAVGGALVAIVFIARLAVSQLGGFPIAEVMTTVITISVFSLLFGAISLLITFMAVQGAALTAGAIPAIVGLVAAGAVLHLLQKYIPDIIQKLGGFTMEQITSTITALGGMVLLFGAVSLLFVGLGLLGATVTATGGLAYAAAIAGFVAAAGVLALAVPFIQWVVGEIGYFKQEQIDVVFNALRSVVELFTMVSLILAGFVVVANKSNASSLKEAAVGMGVVSGVVYTLAHIATDLLKSVATLRINEEKVKAVSAIIDSMANLLVRVGQTLVTMTLGGRASVVGAIIGFDASRWGNIVDVLVGRDGMIPKLIEMTKGIITHLAGISGDPNKLKDMAAIFSDIAKGVAELIVPMSKAFQVVAGSSGNSLWGLIFGGDWGPKFDEVIEAVQGFLDHIFSNKAGEKGLVPALVDAFKDFSYDQIQSLKVGTEMLKAIGEPLAKLIEVLPQVLKSANEISDQFYGESSVQTARILGAVGSMIGTILSHLSGVITSTLTGVQNILRESAVTPEKLNAVKSIGEILSGLGGLMKALIPDTETIKAFQQVTSTYGEGSSSTTGIDGTALGRYLSSLRTELGKIISGEDGQGGVLAMIRQFSGLNLSPSQIDNLKAISPLMSALGDLFTKLMPSQQILERITQQVQGTEHRGTQAAHNIGLISWYLREISQFVTTITGTIKTMITEMATTLQNVTPSAIEGLKAIGPIMAAVGSLFNSLMPSADIMNRILTTTRQGGLTPEQMGKNKTDMLAFMDSMRDQINKLFFGADNKPGIKQLITDIVAIIRDANLTETGVKALTVVGSMIESISHVLVSLLQAVNSFTSGMSPASADAGRIYQAGVQTTSIINSLQGFISSIIDKIPELVRQVATIQIPRGFASMVNNLKSLFELISSAVSIAGSIRGMRTERDVATNTNLDVQTAIIDPLFAVLDGLLSGTGATKLQGIINMISGTAFKGLSRIGGRLKGLSSLFNAVKSFADAANSLKSINQTTGTGAAQTQTAVPANLFDTTFQSITNVINALTTGQNNPLINTTNERLVALTEGARKAIVIKNKFISLKDSLSSLQEASNSLRNINIPEVSNMQSNLTNLQRTITNMDTFFSSRPGGQESVGVTIDRIVHSVREQSIGKVRSMVTAYNDFVNELRNLSGGDGPLRVALTNLGTTLGGRQTLAVQNAAVKAQINVSVTIDSREIAASLRDTTYRTETAANQKAFNTGAFNPNYTGYN